MQKWEFKPGGCGWGLLLALALVAIKYVGVIIGIGLIIAAIYLQAQDAWQNREGKLKAMGMIAAGMALCAVQGLLLYDSYRDDHPAPTPVAEGPIPERFRGVWSSDLQSCDDRYSRMTIDENSVDLSSGSMDADKVSMPNPNTLVISGASVVHMGGDYGVQKDSQTLVLSQNDKVLTVADTTSVRCPVAVASSEEQ